MASARGGGGVLDKGASFLLCKKIGNQIMLRCLVNHLEIRIW